MRWKKQVEAEILAILRRSPVPEDYQHALNVREWVRRLKPDADTALELAALSHDLERAMPARKVQRRHFRDYDAFKRAHAENSARIVQEILTRHGVETNLVRRVTELVRHHEFGKDGDADASVLKDADSLSFFEINLPHYFAREGAEETRARMLWGYRRLSPRARKHLSAFRYDDERLNHLLQELKEMSEPMELEV